MPAHAAEERVFRSHWQDGSLDFFGGVSTLAIGLCWLSDMAWAGAIVPALVVPFWGVWRRRIVEPRLGQVRFQSERRQALRRGLLGIFLMGCFSLGFGILVILGFDRLQDEGWLWLLPGLPALLIAVGVTFAALLLGLSRFLIYAAGFVLAGIVVASLGLRPGYAITAGGAVATAGGLFLLLRFVHGFPVGDPELR